MATRKDILPQWEKAKKDFEKITGKKKPKPKGTFAKMFNHSGLTGDFKKADKIGQALEGTSKPKEKAKFIAAGKKHIPVLQKSTKEYMKQLEAAKKDEVSDKNSETVYAKGLAFLKDRLDHLETLFESHVEREEIWLRTDIGNKVKLVKQLNVSLRTVIKNGMAGAKKVAADPTPARFNEIFGDSDNPARKIQVQLVQAAKHQAKGEIPETIVDPKYIASMYDTWQAGGKGDAKAEEDWDANRVKTQLQAFVKPLQLAERFTTDLLEKMK